MPQNRTRRKIELLGSYDAYRNHVAEEEAKQSEQAERESQMAHQSELRDKDNGYPNVIGNVEDFSNSLAPMNLNAPPFEADGDGYKDLTSMVTKSKRRRQQQQQ